MATKKKATRNPKKAKPRARKSAGTVSKRLTERNHLQKQDPVMGAVGNMLGAGLMAGVSLAMVDALTD